MGKEKAISLESSLLMKRPSEESPDSQEDNLLPRKKMVFEESLRIGKDIKVLRFQHTKLKQGLEQRQKEGNDLIDRIGQLENRQTQDDAVINVINRYWNQLNEDLRILLQRYGPETVDDTKNVEAEATASFLAQLSTWDKTELDEKLASRVQISKQAVEKIIEAFDRLQQQNEKVSKAIKDDFPSIDEIIKEESVRAQEENQTLINFKTDLQEKLEGMGLKFISLTDKLNGEETTTDELQNQVDNLSWEVNKLLSYNDKLTNHIQDLSEKYRRLQQMYATEEKKRKEIEEVREQASNLLNELENLHKTQIKTLKQLEKLKIKIRQLPEAVIVETNAYKCLQSKFSVIYNDTLNFRMTLDETRNQLLMLRTTHQ